VNVVGLVPATQRRSGAAGQFDVVTAVAISGGRQPIRLGETLESVVPQRLEHLIPAGRAGRHKADERSLRERPHDRFQLRRRRPHHGRRGGHIEPSEEHRQLVEDVPLGLAQQLVRPVDCVPQCLEMPRHARCLAGQQPEPLVKALRHLLHRHRARSRGGQLDREWQAVELSTNFEHSGAGHRIVVESRPGLLGALDEQCVRIAVDSRDSVSAYVEWLDADNTLARHAEGLPTRGDDDLAPR
jgi:hypothetical protein